MTVFGTRAEIRTWCLWLHAAADRVARHPVMPRNSRNSRPYANAVRSDSVRSRFDEDMLHMNNHPSLLHGMISAKGAR